AVDGVVLEQMGEGGGVGDVIDGHELELRAPLVGGTEQVAPDPSEAIDPNCHWCHALCPPSRQVRGVVRKTVLDRGTVSATPAVTPLASSGRFERRSQDRR